MEELLEFRDNPDVHILCTRPMSDCCWTGLLKTLVSVIHWLNLIQWINFSHMLIFVAQILSTG